MLDILIVLLATAIVSLLIFRVFAFKRKPRIKTLDYKMGSYIKIGRTRYKFNIKL